MQRKGRVRIRLYCTECETRNYSIFKAPGEQRGTLVLKKHCSTCNRHTEHREAV